MGTAPGLRPRASFAPSLRGPAFLSCGRRVGPRRILRAAAHARCKGNNRLMSQRILVVDDEANIRDLARLYLEKEGFSVEVAVDGRDAIARFAQVQPSLVVLDLMMPGMDGFEVCRELRRESDVPILMVTARNEDVDKIVGLELGADDYLTKPFNPREMVARVKAILRRFEGGRKPQTALTVANLSVDKARREAKVDDEALTLRTKEFDLLTAFVENPGIALTRDQLLETVWGYNYAGETRTVDVHVQHLRAKLTKAKVQIETLRGVGYKLVDAAPEV
jgi:two-component system, OmpR family, alkaline phosphatase synthesis response regulator PhoP